MEVIQFMSVAVGIAGHTVAYTVPQIMGIVQVLQLALSAVSTLWLSCPTDYGKIVQVIQLMPCAVRLDLDALLKRTMKNVRLREHKILMSLEGFLPRCFFCEKRDKTSRCSPGAAFCGAGNQRSPRTGFNSVCGAEHAVIKQRQVPAVLCDS